MIKHPDNVLQEWAQWLEAGYVDHTTYSFPSILKFVEDTFRLPALTSLDQQAASLSHTLDFSRSTPPLVLPTRGCPGFPHRPTKKRIVEPAAGVAAVGGLFAISLGAYLARRRRSFGLVIDRFSPLIQLLLGVATLLSGIAAGTYIWWTWPLPG